MSTETDGTATREKGGRARPRIALWLTNNVAKALDYRLSRNDTIVMGGYSRSYQIASHLAQLAGHPLYCQTMGATFGPDGWVKP